MDTGFEEFERRGLEGTLGTIVRVRIALLVVLAVFCAWIGTHDPATWRRVTLGLALLTLAVLDTQTRRRYLRFGYEPRIVRLNLSLALVIHGALVFATGGLASPLLPVLLPLAFAVGVLEGRRGIHQLVFGVQLPILGVFGALHLTHVLPSFVPAPFDPPGGSVPEAMFIAAVTMAILLVLLARLGAHVRVTAQTHLSQLATARDSALASHRQRVSDLTTLSAEIAHELKNPLASIKGLSQLLERTHRGDPTRTRERLAILTREASRMQSILDEFLNFSRPLSPLVCAPVDLWPLCSDIVALYQTTAAERGIRVHLRVPANLQIRGDARKLSQILINLLQNAFEAAPRDSEVTLLAYAKDAVVHLEIGDRGAGLDPAMRAQMFAAGVTSKAKGSGLGLTVARAIAQQHGGSLELDDRPGGGCRARVTVPVEGPITDATHSGAA